MGEIKKLHVKNRTYYFYNDIINLQKFDARLLKKFIVDKKSYKRHWHLQLGYIKKEKIDDYEKIYSVNPLLLAMKTDILKRKA